MKIGVVADTHSKNLPKQMLDDFKGVELIVHAGDFCSLDVLEHFKKLKEVRAVHGNMDEHNVRKELPRRQVFNIGPFVIGIYHGEGAPNQLLDKVKEEFKTEKVDAVIFGHSHRPFNEVVDNVLYFNPGSPNDTIFAPYCSYGILDLSGPRIQGQIIKVKGK